MSEGPRKSSFDFSERYRKVGLSHKLFFMFICTNVDPYRVYN